jgi:TonB-linked SusC/RagA family outer membrane protein
MKLAKILTIVAALVCCNFSMAQTNGIVKGRVVVEGTDKPLKSASITLIGAKKATATDDNGNFYIKLPDEKKQYKLSVTYQGYATKEIAVKAGDNITFKLKEDVKDEGEVVIQTGYGGGIKKKEATFSASNIGAKDLKDVPITSVGEALNGRLAGVTATTAEGSPDAQINIKVRGGISITGDNSPLYVVDGVIVENGLNNISLQDIQDINVLKDAAATAIYGARGANGVIVVTTKSGKSGKLKVTYNTYYGFKRLTKTLNVLSPYDFVIAQYEREIDNPADFASFKTNYGSTWDTLNAYKDATVVDWQKQVMGLYGNTQQHNVTLSGANKKTNYFGGYTYQNDDAIVINSKLRKHQANFKIEHKLTDKIKLQGSVRYTNQNIYGVGVSDDNTSFARLKQALKYRPYLKNGEDPANIDIIETPGAGIFLINPLKLAAQEFTRKTTNTLNSSGSVTYNIKKNFTFKSTFGYEKSTVSNTQFSDTITPTARIQNSSTGNPILTLDTTTNEVFTNSNVLTYSLKNFKKHHDFDILLGEETYDLRSTQIQNLYDKLPRGLGAANSIDAIASQHLYNVAPIGYPKPYQSRSTLLSFFTRMNYSLDKKYFFNFVLRADGSSKFTPQNRWGIFPSGSFAWRVSNEKFFQKVKVINDLKLRLSYGTNGNSRIQDYLGITSFNSTTYYYGLNGQPYTAYSLSNIKNPDLKWEALVNRNIGIDFSLFNKRIDISADYYINESKDLLLDIPIANTYGYNTQTQNVGKSENRGFELQLNAIILQKKNGFNWSANFNISFNKNKIVELKNGLNALSPEASWGIVGKTTDYIAQVGQPVGSMFGFVTDGFYKAEDFTSFTPGSSPGSPGTYTLKSGVPASAFTSKPLEPGMIKFKDIDNSGVIDSKDKQIIGNPTPKFTGGFNQQFSYKNWDLSLFFNFSYGNSVYNANKIELTNDYTANANYLGVMQNRWRIVDESGTRITNLSELANLNKNATIWRPTRNGTDFLVHSWAIEDGSFLRLNNMTIGYSLPITTLIKMHISRLRFYITGNNLAIFTKYSGYDPEVSVRKSPLTPGLDYSAYPKSRSVIVGLNVNF